MKLNLEQIKAITKGAAEVTEENGCFHFYRFTKEQRETYGQLRPQYNEKVLSSSGVRFAMETDSDYLAFDYSLQTGSSRPYGFFDVYENGTMTRHFGEMLENHKLETREEIPLSKGLKRVEVYFPWSCVTTISNVEVADGAQVKPLEKKRRMLAFGDSITQGYSAIYPSLTYMSRITDMLDAECFNKAIGGDRFFPELAETVDPVKPDLITVAYGTNDWNCCTRDFVEERCRQFYQALAKSYPKVQIFAITPIWRKDGNKQTKFGAPQPAVADLIADVCAEIPGITVIRGGGFAPWVEDFFEDKYLHPNDMGFDFYARNLYNALVPYIK